MAGRKHTKSRPQGRVVKTRAGDRATARAKGPAGPPPRKGTPKEQDRSFWGDFARYSVDAGVFLMTGFIALAAGVAWFARDLPSTDKLWRSERAPRMTFLAADGTPLRLHASGAGAPVRLSELPPHVPNAVLAVEDRNFHHHIGVNPVSVLRAFAVNAASGQVRQGGSTITQQLAKNIFLSPDKTIKRKVQELLLAFWLEHRFTKDEILTLYLNRVYFGGGAYGVDAASRYYFDKPATRLSVGEAAVLAGLLKAPSRYAPTHNPKDAGLRARIVIEAMQTAKFLSPKEAKRALATPIVLTGTGRITAPYFLDYAARQVRIMAKGYDADLLIQTTLDPDFQTALDAGLRAGIAQADLDDEIQLAAVLLDGEGAVRAMAGGRDYGASQFNRATQAVRQPGSAFKPFIYLAALEQGASVSTRVLDAPVSVGAWRPKNYKNKYKGEVGFKEALALSLNSAAVRVQERAGRGAVRVTARRMGFDAKLTAGPALALGVDAVSPLTLAGAYAPFANGGLRVTPHGVKSVKTADGQQVYHSGPAYAGLAADPRAIEGVNEMLRAVPAWGTGKAAALERYVTNQKHVAHGKTGTTQNSRDAWFAGHAGGLTLVVWVGRDNYAPMDGVTGGTAPAIIWREAMARALAHQDARQAPASLLPPLAQSPYGPKSMIAQQPSAPLSSQGLGHGPRGEAGPQMQPAGPGNGEDLPILAPLRPLAPAPEAMPTAPQSQSLPLSQTARDPLSAILGAEGF